LSKVKLQQDFFPETLTGIWLLTVNTALLKTSVGSDVVMDVVVDVNAGVDVDDDVDDEELDAGFASDGATEPFVEEL
jgi:hypothetical protein